jgi:hypothetical protein
MIFRRPLHVSHPQFQPPRSILSSSSSVWSVCSVGVLDHANNVLPIATNLCKERKSSREWWACWRWRRRNARMPRLSPSEVAKEIAEEFRSRERRSGKGGPEATLHDEFLEKIEKYLDGKARKRTSSSSARRS